ncbi:hypothetical protein GJ629_03455 [Halapricum sp. CBA1109]|uniref:SIR2 family protein n=1 Tax=Halapricum sp. CBA1109 TaxID=2668068 RepID=UPI0012FBBFF8|nr:SIR2 family protein [Halapricum sp. CBA1109]MUV89072.1 hypothetical protein [Halapricum sp. CBA1109]
MLSEDSQHRIWAEDTISDCLDRHEYAPIIFVGSGISRRYLGAPSWRELLSELATICPEIEYPIEYYEEEYTNPQIATQFINAFRDWAWEDHGQFEHFPRELYDRDGSPDKYLKYKVAEFFRKLSPDSPDDLPDDFQEEIKALRQISPHAVVTTNYDQLLENIYPGFETMVGQDIYKKDRKKVGDLFKIHGCVTQEDSLILTKSDYDDFEKQKKYISAKLLTYFSEHPVLILGHSASDDNIQRLLSELDRMIPTDETDLIPNIFLLNYEDGAEKLEGDPNLSRDELIDVGDERRVRVNAVHAHSFKWVYDAFGQGEASTKFKLSRYESSLTKYTT